MTGSYQYDWQIDNFSRRVIYLTIGIVDPEVRPRTDYILFDLDCIFGKVAGVGLSADLFCCGGVGIELETLLKAR